MNRSFIHHGLLALAVAAWAASPFAALANETTAATTVTNATGTITQVNYDSNGNVQGFLLGANTLLTFSGTVCGGLSTLGVVSNSVTYSGTVFTASSGFETVSVTSFTNTTTKAMYTMASFNGTAYGPTTGTVAQLNYANGGAIDGFVFAPSGGASSIFVSTGPRASSTLTSLLTVGATVSVTGETSSRLSACSASGTLAAVDATALTISGQTIVIGGGYPGGGYPGGGNPGHR